MNPHPDEAKAKEHFFFFFFCWNDNVDCPPAYPLHQQHIPIASSDITTIMNDTKNQEVVSDLIGLVVEALGMEFLSSASVPATVLEVVPLGGMILPAPQLLKHTAHPMQKCSPVYMEGISCENASVFAIFWGPSTTTIDVHDPGSADPRPSARL